jgi:hypothetical protein
MESLQMMQMEDPSFSIRVDSDTGQESDRNSFHTDLLLDANEWNGGTSFGYFEAQTFGMESIDY